jgi:hypothetical protein
MTVIITNATGMRLFLTAEIVSKTVLLVRCFQATRRRKARHLYCDWRAHGQNLRVDDVGGDEGIRFDFRALSAPPIVESFRGPVAFEDLDTGRKEGPVDCRHIVLKARN